MSEAPLQQVIYQIFESDVLALEAPEAENLHTLDREIRFAFSDDTNQFASWTQSKNDFCITIKPESFYNEDSEFLIRDMSQSQMWFKLIGTPIDFIPLDIESQIIEVRSPVGSIYLSTQENGLWGMDVITVSNKPVSYTS
jgi:hypothetical protein